MSSRFVPERLTNSQREARHRHMERNPSGDVERKTRLASDRERRDADNASSGVAIIAAAGRYPRSADLEALWRNLVAGKDCVTEIPRDRWDADRYYDADKTRPGAACSKWGGFIEDIDKFDPLFFNISPNKARIVNPQGRIFLETVWHLLENAGLTRESLRKRHEGRVGLYVGAMHQQHEHGGSGDRRIDDPVNSSCGAIANRASHFFGLEGPSLAVDTMCSSAAVALHLACRDLQNGECELAIAGGVNVAIHPNKFIALTQLQVLGSHRDRRSFADGDGYLPAEGVGAVLLKPLTAAVADGDSILAVIRGSAVHHGGRHGAYATPSYDMQVRLIANLLAKANIDPRTVSYVEAAAYGSAKADAVEIAALSAVFRRFTDASGFCAIGSVKSNIGHAEAASAMAQLAKIILQLQHGQLVPSIQAQPANPEIQFDNSPFYLSDAVAEWKRPVVELAGTRRETPRRAMINAFGAGGCYAGLIVEEYMPVHPEATPDTAGAEGHQLVVFSARNAERLRAVVERNLCHLEQYQSATLADVAYTLQVGREAMDARLATVVRDREELIRTLRTYLSSAANPAGPGSAPIFLGDVNDRPAPLRARGNDASARSLVAAGDLEKIAEEWTQGATIPWRLLHRATRQIVALPTYPFARERCGISVGADGNDATRAAARAAPATGAHERVRRYIADRLSQALGVEAKKIRINKDLADYGVDSVIGLRLIRAVQDAFGVALSGRELLEHRTVNAFARHVAQKVEELGRRKPMSIGFSIEALDKFKQGAFSARDIKKLFDQDVTS